MKKFYLYFKESVNNFDINSNDTKLFIFRFFLFSLLVIFSSLFFYLTFFSFFHIYEMFFVEKMSSELKVARDDCYTKQLDYKKKLLSEANSPHGAFFIFVYNNAGPLLFGLSVLSSLYFLNGGLFFDESGNIVKYVSESTDITKIFVKSSVDSSWKEVSSKELLETAVSEASKPNERTWIEYLYSWFFQNSAKSLNNNQGLSVEASENRTWVEYFYSWFSQKPKK